MHHKVKNHALDPVPVRTFFAVAKSKGYFPRQTWLCGAIWIPLTLAGSNRYLEAMQSSTLIECLLSHVVFVIEQCAASAARG